MATLKIENLHVSIDDKEILKGINLTVNSNEIHALMGPNGNGKSTLLAAIMGHPKYNVTSGSITLDGKDVFSMSVDERSRAGLFLAMQYPLEIDGVSNQDFLRTAMSSHQEKNVGLYDFIVNCEKATEELKMDKNLIHRSLNVGFSGGEKKKNEVLQIKLLKPKFIILDEIDSGLDVDSLKIVAKNIVKYKEENKDIAILIITHLTKILEYIKPDYVHVLGDGHILKTGDYSLALDIEKDGYKKYLDKSNIMLEE